MTTKLSKPMQDAMWGRGYYELNTARALEKRGLAKVRVTYAYGGRTVHLDLTGAGRAWIAEQVEAARVEALEQHVNRALRWATVASSLGPADAAMDAYVAALALAARWGVDSCPREIVERDEAEAYEAEASPTTVNASMTHQDAAGDAGSPLAMFGDEELLTCPAHPGTAAVDCVICVPLDEVP